MAKKAWRVEWHGDVVLRHLEVNARDRLFEAATFMRGKVVGILRGNRSGKVYRIPGTSKFYTASAPGEAPASRLGALRTGIIIRTSADRKGAKALIGPRTFKGNYPMALEFGTRDGKIKPRPFMRPAFSQAKARLQTILTSGWQPL